MTMKNCQFMTAKEKKRVLKQWVTFIKQGCRLEDFTKPLYHHLTQHCSFIAHYDRQGFYDAYFHRPADTARFFRQFDEDHDCLSAEYGGVWWLNGDYQDINSAMCRAIEPFKKQIYEQCLKVEKEQDLSQARVLLSKHGIQPTF